MWRIILILSLTLLFTGAAAAQESGVSPSTSSSQPVDSESARDDAELIEGVKTGDLAKILKLLDQGVSPDTADDEGTTALSWAVKSNHPEVIEILLKRKATVNKEDKTDGGTALDVAAAEGRADLAKLLIAHGADVNHKDNSGHTALMLAAFGATLKKAPIWLASSFFEINEDDVLFKMMGDEHLGAAKLLLDAGANVDAQGGDCSLTALMVAAMGGNVELTELLLKRGANVKLVDGEWTALKFAEELDSPEASKQVSEEVDDEDQRQAFLNWLHFTAPGRREVAAMLRKAGAN